MLYIPAVGVDDAFVIITTWNRINKQGKQYSIEERVAITMQHAGVSVTVTSFSDLVAFACGISTVSFIERSAKDFCSDQKECLKTKYNTITESEKGLYRGVKAKRF